LPSAEVKREWRRNAEAIGQERTLRIGGCGVLDAPVKPGHDSWDSLPVQNNFSASVQT
jgi:hypothetical protein